MHCQKQAGRATGLRNSLTKSTKADDLSTEAIPGVTQQEQACVTKVPSHTYGGGCCPSATMVDALTATPRSSRRSQC